MRQTSVEQFASELGVRPTVLLEQLRAAGVNKLTIGDSLTETDKTQLIEYLRGIHSSREEKGKIFLPRRQTSETGKVRSIQLEVRKKRILIKDEPSDKPGLDIVHRYTQLIGSQNLLLKFECKEKQPKYKKSKKRSKQNPKQRGLIAPGIPKGNIFIDRVSHLSKQFRDPKKVKRRMPCRATQYNADGTPKSTKVI